MNKFQNKEGNQQSALSIVQRELLVGLIFVFAFADICLGSIEILSRQDPRAEGQIEGEQGL